MKRPVLRPFVLTTLSIAALACGPLCGQERPSEATVQAVDQSTAAFEFVTQAHGNPLGVEIAPLDAALRAQLGVEEGIGVVVTSIVAEKDAAQVGLKQHDVVLKFDEWPVTSPVDFHKLIESEQGKTIYLHVLRQGKRSSVPVNIPKSPVYALFNYLDAGTAVENRYRIGVTLAEADDTLRSQLNLAAGEGLVVTDVVADGPAANAGIKRHDVLTRLDNKRLSAVENANAQIQEIKNRAVTVVFLRGGQEKSCEVAPQLSSESATAPFRMKLRLERDSRRWIGAPIQTDGEFLVAPKDGVRWHSKSALTTFAEALRQQPAKVASEISELKKQLGQMQKTLESLETALQPPAQEKPQPPKEGKR